MDFTQILSALNSADNASAASNPYAPISSAADNFNQLMLGLVSKNPTNFSVGDVIAPALIGGLVSGISGGLGDQYKADQGALARNVLADALAGRTLAAPDGVSPSVFNAASNTGESLKLAQDLTSQAEIKQQATKKVIDDPLAAEISKRLGGPDLYALAGIAHPVSSNLTSQATPKTIADDKTNDSPILKALGSSVDTGTGDAGAVLAPDTTASPGKTPPGQVSEDYINAVIAAGGDTVRARQMLQDQYQQQNKNKLLQPQVATLSNSITVARQLADLKNQVDKIQEAPAGTPDILQGLLTAGAADLNPSSAPAIYNQSVTPLADRTMRALTEVGRGSQYSNQKIMEGLQTALGRGPDAQKQIIDAYINDIISGAQEKAQSMIAAGYPGADPVLQRILAVKAEALGGGGALTQEKYNQLRSTGWTPDQIKAAYGG